MKKKKGPRNGFKKKVTTDLRKREKETQYTNNNLAGNTEATWGATRWMVGEKPKYTASTRTAERDDA